MPGPFFSVLVSTYNRAPEVERCVRSCVAQTFEDFEIVVVDDASTDRTAESLAALEEPRLRVVRHEHNRGISPARATAVKHAAGEWFVVLDSDWELFPHSLARLRAVIDELPADVHIVRSRLQADDGTLQPGIMPTGITGYHERLQWLEELSVRRASSDAGHCIHRSVFETTNYLEDRRGAMEALWETNLARRERSLWLADILGMQHVDAANSHSRDAEPSRLIPRLLLEAPDDLWMAETMLAEHGAELARYAPHTRRLLMERAATQAFLTGDRRRGLRHTLSAVRSGSRDSKVWVTTGLGLLGPRALAYVKLARRRRRPGAPRQAVRA
jgi:glycosyltransferase involved in cell wall biosynthesis